MVYCDFEYRLYSMEVGSSSRDLTPRVTIQSHSGSCGSWISSCFKRVLYWHGGARQRKQHPYHYRGRMIRCRQTSAHKSARIILSHHQLCPGYVCAASLWKKMCVDMERQTISLLLMIIVLWFLGSSINLLRCMHDFYGCSWIWSAQFLQVTCFRYLGSTFLELAGNSETSLWDRMVTWQVGNKLKASSDPWLSPADLGFHLWDIQSEKIWQSEIYAQYWGRSMTSWPMEKV